MEALTGSVRYIESEDERNIYRCRISLLVFCASEKQTKSATPDGVNTPTVQKYAGYSTPDEVTTPTVQKPAGYSTPDGVTTPTVEWLGSTLLPKVVQWSEESGRGEVSTVRQEPLVSLAKYCTLYRELRERYAPTLIQVSFVHAIICVDSLGLSVSYYLMLCCGLAISYIYIIYIYIDTYLDLFNNL